jgi:hypothetical protein
MGIDLGGNGCEDVTSRLLGFYDYGNELWGFVKCGECDK